MIGVGLGFVLFFSVTHFSIPVGEKKNYKNENQRASLKLTPGNVQQITMQKDKAVLFNAQPRSLEQIILAKHKREHRVHEWEMAIQAAAIVHGERLPKMKPTAAEEFPSVVTTSNCESNRHAEGKILASLKSMAKLPLISVGSGFAQRH